MTYKLPSMNVPASAIFREIFTSKRQIDEVGSRRRAKSVKMLGIEYPRKKCFSAIHVEGMFLFQYPETGTH